MRDMGEATPKSRAEPVRQKGSPLFTARWVLVSDIDNTLLGDRGALEDLLGWIQRRTGEVAFGVATGRTLASTLRVLREWKVPVPDFLITAVGSEIYYGPKLRRDEEWRDYLRQGWRRESLARALRAVPGLRLQERAHQREFKLSYLCDPACMPPLSEIQRKLQRLGLSFNLIHSHGKFLDILPARASKGHAIRYLATQWNLPLKRFLVAGDSGNDAEMMLGDTLGVVVGNFSEELAVLRGEHRVYFASRCHAGGVLEGIAHYGFGNVWQDATETEEGPTAGS